MQPRTTNEGSELRLGPLVAPSRMEPTAARRRSRPDPLCIIDRERPCRGCIAASPRECPYPYLLD